MNEVDIRNIKNILKIREIEFERGGEYSVSHLEKMETKYLNTLVRNYEKESESKYIEKIHSLVDKAFAEFADESDNMIAFDCCEIYDNRPCSRDPYEIIDWDDRESFNNTAFPISRFWEYDIEDQNERKERQKKFDELVYEIRQIVYEKLNVKDICDYWDHDDSLNEFWFSVYAITKDYNIVTFVIRYDGLMQSDKLINVKQL